MSVQTQEAAYRLARAIVSDIAVYNEKKLKLGIEQDDLFVRLEQDIKEGLAHYQSRASSIDARAVLFHHALVDVLYQQALTRAQDL